MPTKLGINRLAGLKIVYVIGMLIPSTDVVVWPITNIPLLNLLLAAAKTG